MRKNSTCKKILLPNPVSLIPRVLIAFSLCSVGKNREGEEQKERLIPPKQIDDIGDEAFWVSNRFTGVLYV
jgi:hypothetical protein